MGSSGLTRDGSEAEPTNGPSHRWPEGSFLADLSETTRAALLDLGVRRAFSNGQVLITQGDRDTEVFVLTEGVVKVTAMGEDESPRLIDVQVAGDTVGEISFTDDRPRSATVAADGQVHAVVISQRELSGFFGDHPDAAVALSRVMSRRDRAKQRRYLDVTQFDARTRLARVLAGLAVKCGRPTPEGLELAVTLAQSELAALVGVAEPSVHKALRALRSEGVVRTTYRRIVILDEGALRRIGQLRGDTTPPTRENP